MGAKRSSSITARWEAEYSVTDTGVWVHAEMGASGIFFLIASFSQQMKQSIMKEGSRVLKGKKRTYEKVI